MENNRSSPRQVLLSILFTTGVAVLIVGAVAAVILARRTLADPTSSVSPAAAVAAGLFVYGPTLLVNAWPVTLPVIVAVGVGFAFMRRCIQVPRWIEIAFTLYGGIFVVVAVTMALAAH
jgi:hypothetical protein